MNNTLTGIIEDIASRKRANALNRVKHATNGETTWFGEYEDAPAESKKLGGLWLTQNFELVRTVEVEVIDRTLDWDGDGDDYLVNGDLVEITYEPADEEAFNTFIEENVLAATRNEAIKLVEKAGTPAERGLDETVTAQYEFFTADEASGYFRKVVVRAYETGALYIFDQVSVGSGSLARLVPADDASREDVLTAAQWLAL